MTILNEESSNDVSRGRCYEERWLCRRMALIPAKYAPSDENVNGGEDANTRVEL